MSDSLVIATVVTACLTTTELVMSIILAVQTKQQDEERRKRGKRVPYFVRYLFLPALLALALLVFIRSLDPMGRYLFSENVEIFLSYVASSLLLYLMAIGCATQLMVITASITLTKRSFPYYPINSLLGVLILVSIICGTFQILSQPMLAGTVFTLVFKIAGFTILFGYNWSCFKVRELITELEVASKNSNIMAQKKETANLSKAKASLLRVQIIASLPLAVWMPFNIQVIGNDGSRRGRDRSF